MAYLSVDMIDENGLRLLALSKTFAFAMTLNSDAVVYCLDIIQNLSLHLLCTLSSYENLLMAAWWHKVVLEIATLSILLWWKTTE